MVVAFGLALIAPPATALADPPNWYPPLDWVAAARSNYDVGRTMRISAIVIHETDGSWFSAYNWFRNPRSRVSSHYLVRAWDGGIMQFVAESDTAYHARVANPWSIGIEHEYDPRHAIWHTDAQYRSSALLVCAIAKRYGIPADRQHIIGHNEVPGTDHSDPGPTWNWTYYMSLVRSCMGQELKQELTGAPTANLAFGDSGEDVALLQWDLVHLGFMRSDDLADGSGYFGPITQDALSAFQQACGLEATGDYDDASAKEIAKSMANVLVGEPQLMLAPGVESDDVSVLQEQLQGLGYIDRITGYYGPITYDAVASFQRDNGIASSGFYESVTRIALSFRTREMERQAIVELLLTSGTILP